MQGFNMGRYVPPEHEGITSANKLAGKHAFGARARKSAQGILTVRFEMPFSVWCNNCPKPTIIGQGVRFNAEKKKVGNYFSTPIYAFRMKHSVCNGWIEIRTDPQNTAYVVTEGGKKRDTGEDKVLDGEILLGATEEDRARLENDPFAAVESKVEDKTKAASEKTRIEELYKAKQRDWEDPGEANRRLRKGFRVDRKHRQRREEATEALKDKLSLGIDLLDETEEDRRKAGFIEFSSQKQDHDHADVRARPLFSNTETARTPKRLNSKRDRETDPDIRLKQLKTAIGNNTRTALDPFLGKNATTMSSNSFRKRDDLLPQKLSDSKPVPSGALVDYDSE